MKKKFQRIILGFTIPDFAKVKSGFQFTSLIGQYLYVLLYLFFVVMDVNWAKSSFVPFCSLTKNSINGPLRCRCCFLIKNSDSLSVYPTYFSHLARSTPSMCKVGVCFVDTWELKIWTLPPTLGLIGRAIRGGIVFSTDFAFLHHFRKKTECF